MATDESLLDVFVVVGIKETGENVDQYVDRVKKVFGELASSGSKGPAAVKKSVESIREEFDRLSAKVKLTNAQIDRMTQLAMRLDGAAVSAAQLRRNAVLAGSAVGGLTNNAYQLGQAFEDAAVGFQLNGIAGAVRGASNNITFLINNLAQARIEQAKLNGQTVSPLLASLPLYAAIGASIALLVAGPLSDWVKGLNDIELTSKGVAETIAKEFGDAKFLVQIELDNRSALKAVQDAETAKEAIATVIRQAEASEELRFQITAELERVSQRDVFENLSKALADLEKASNIEVERLTADSFIDPAAFAEFVRLSNQVSLTAEEFAKLKKLSAELDELGVNVETGTIAADPKDSQVVRNLAAAIDTVRIASKQAFEQAEKGIVPRGELESARDAVQLLKRDYEELAKSGVLSEEATASLGKTIETLLAPLQAATEQAIKFEEAQAQLLDSTLKQLGLFSELSAESRFLNEVNQGRLDKEDKILFDIREQNIELEKQAEKARAAIGQNNPQLEAGLGVAADVLQEEQRIGLISEINDLEKDIADRRADAAIDEERAAKRRLEIEEKIGDEIIKGQERIASAEAALQSEKDKQTQDARQAAIQARIDALQQQDKTSSNFAVGSLGTQAFGDDVKPEIERLQEELKTLRADEAKKAASDRIKDLEARIISEREEAQNRLENLRDDLADARQAEIDAVNKNAEETQKLVDQLRQFQEALLNVKLGLDPQADQVERDKLFFNDPKLADQADRQRIENEERLKEIEKKREELREFQGNIDKSLQDKIREEVAGGRPLTQDEWDEAKRVFDEEKRLIEDIDRLKSGPDKMGFLPEDDIRGIRNAQAEANAAAMDNVDFKSTSLETLTEQTNRLLFALNDGVSRLDMQTRLA